MASEGESLAQQIRAEVIQLDQYEAEIDDIRRAYERYFSGLDKREPNRQRTRLQRALLHSPLSRSHRAEVRFRMSTLVQRFASYCIYWDRLIRQLESGVLRREGFGRFAPAPTATDASPATASPATATAAPPPRPVDPPPPAGAPELATRELYVEYRDACRLQAGTHALSFDEFSRRVNERFAALTGRSDVRLHVRTHGGKVTLVAMKSA